MSTDISEVALWDINICLQQQEKKGLQIGPFKLRHNCEKAFMHSFGNVFYYWIFVIKHLLFRTQLLFNSRVKQKSCTPETQEIPQNCQRLWQTARNILISYQWIRQKQQPVELGRKLWRRTTCIHQLTSYILYWWDRTWRNISKS